MIHVIIERANLAEAKELARAVYQQAIRSGRHVLMDAPGDLRTNLPERSLSAVEILISARLAPQHNVTTTTS